MPGDNISHDADLACLAFADDLMLANGAPQVQDLVNKTKTFLRNLGMQLSVQKCATFRVVPTGDGYYINDPAIVTNKGEEIPCSRADSHLKYLGMNVSPWHGIDVRTLRQKIKDCLKRVKRLSLKLNQKLNLIS